MAAYRIVRLIGTLERGAEKPWTRKALLVAGSHKGWVLASGRTREECKERLEELIEAQVRDWGVRDE